MGGMHVKATLAIATMVTVGFGAMPAGGPAVRASALSAAGLLAHAAASAAPGPVIHAATPAGVRSAGGLGWYSSNWAGYALAAGPYRSVSGQWTVPTVSPSGRAAYSAQWVGVDGVSSASLIQAGTQVNFVNGSPQYSAWWEILPAPAVAIRTLTVRAGDVISVTIARVSAGRWRITLKDSRSGSFTTIRAYAGSGTSAEWIEEAPFIGWRIPPLAAHAPVVFDNATVNGTMAHLSMGDAGAMLRRGIVVDTPSAPDADGNGFAVAEQATPPDRPTQT
jgi:hypothetical protein